MFADHVWVATSRCPRCGDIFHLTSDPEIDHNDRRLRRLRRITPGAPLPATFPVKDLATADATDSLLRVRAPGPVIRTMTRGPDLKLCECGAFLLVVLQFSLGTPPTFDAVQLREVLAPDLADDLDLVPQYLLFASKGCVQDPSLGRDSTHAERLARLHAALPHFMELLQPYDLDASLADLFGDPDPTASQRPRVHGPTRCAVCGDVRVRDAHAGLFPGHYPGTFFGPDRPDHDLQPGTRIACDLTWLTEDRDRCAFVRLRHPVPEDSLTLMGTRTDRGCRCGAGPGVFVLHFAREPAALTLRQIELRVVRSLADLADIDFAECSFRTRDLAPGAKPHRKWSRDEVHRWILHELT